MKKVNCAKNSMIAMIYSDYRDLVNIPYNCNGYPTIRMYKDGRVLKNWKGDWTSKGVLEKRI